MGVRRTHRRAGRCVLGLNGADAALRRGVRRDGVRFVLDVGKELGCAQDWACSELAVISVSSIYNRRGIRLLLLCGGWEVQASFLCHGGVRFGAWDGLCHKRRFGV